MHNLLISALLSAAALSPLAHARAVASPDKRGIIWEPAASQDSPNHVLSIESQPVATAAALLEREDSKTTKSSRSRAKPTRATSQAPAPSGASDPAAAPPAFAPGTATLGAPGSSFTWSPKVKRDTPYPPYETAPAEGSISNEIEDSDATGTLSPIDGSSAGGSASLQLSDSTLTFYPSDGGSTTVSAGESEEVAQQVQAAQPEEAVEPAPPAPPKNYPKYPKYPPKGSKTPGYPKPYPNSPPANEPGSFGVEINEPSALAPLNNADGTVGGQQGLELTSSTVTFYPSSGGSSTVTTGKGKGGSSSSFSKRDGVKNRPRPGTTESLSIGGSSVTFYPSNGASPATASSGRQGSRSGSKPHQAIKRDDVVNVPRPGTVESLSIASSSVTFFPAKGGSTTTTTTHPSKRDSAAMSFQA